LLLSGSPAGKAARKVAGELADLAKASDLRLTPFLEAGKLWGSSEVTTICQDRPLGGQWLGVKRPVSATAKGFQAGRLKFRVCADDRVGNRPSMHVLVFMSKGEGSTCVVSGRMDGRCTASPKGE
jgi:hypothetical protein